jgi:cyanate permease
VVKARIKKKALFSPGTHATQFHEFIIGSIFTGIFAGLGIALGQVILRSLIRKYSHEDSFLALGLPT